VEGCGTTNGAPYDETFVPAYTRWDIVVLMPNGVTFFYNNSTAPGTAYVEAPGRSYTLTGLHPSWTTIRYCGNNNLLFYDVNNLVAATGRIGSDGAVAFLNTYGGLPYGDIVTCSADGGVLYYRVGSGSGAFGWVDYAGSLHNEGFNYHVGSYATYYTDLVPVGGPHIVMYKRSTGEAELIQVYANGNYNSWGPMHNFPAWGWNVVGCPKSGLVMMNAWGGASMEVTMVPVFNRFFGLSLNYSTMSYWMYDRYSAYLERTPDLLACD